jgi:hypothetical protein
MQVEIGPVELPDEALFRRSVSMIQQSDREPAPRILPDEKNEDDDPEPIVAYEKPLTPNQVPSLSAKESRTSMDDVRLVAIPSPRFRNAPTSLSNQIPEVQAEVKFDSVDSTSMSGRSEKRTESQDFEANRLVKFGEFEKIPEKNRRKMSRPKKSILKRNASPSTQLRVKTMQDEIVRVTKELSQGTVMIKYSTK